VGLARTISFHWGRRVNDQLLAIDAAIVLGHTFDESGDGGIGVVASDVGYRKGGCGIDRGQLIQ
jgi:hypothetical protein